MTRRDATTSPGATKVAVIVDTQLAGFGGHAAGYAMALAGHLSQLGWRPIVLANRRWPGGTLAGRFEVRGVFERPYHDLLDPLPGPLVETLRWVGMPTDQRRPASIAAPHVPGLAPRPPDLDQIGLSRYLAAPPDPTSLGGSLAGPAWDWLRDFARGRRRPLGWRGSRAGAALLLASLPLRLPAAAVRSLGGTEPTRSTLSPFLHRLAREVRRERRRGHAVRLIASSLTPSLLAEFLALPLLLAGETVPLLGFWHEAPDRYLEWYQPVTLEGLAARLAARGAPPGELGLCVSVPPLGAALGAALAQPVLESDSVFDPDRVATLATLADTPPDLSGLPAGEAAVLERLRAARAAGRRIAVVGGAMRSEKGELAALTGAIARDPRGFLLALQSHPSAAAFAGAPHVSWLPDRLSPAGFDAFLALADVILVPYDAAAYRLRSSHLFKEAALLGRPILATAGLAEFASGLPQVARGLDDWSRWTEAADALLEGGAAAAARPAAVARRAGGAWGAWRGHLEAVLATPARRLPPHALVVSRGQPATPQIAALAGLGLPVVALVVDPDCPPGGRHLGWQRVMTGAAEGAALVTLWTTQPSGVIGWARAAAARDLSSRVALCPLPRELRPGGGLAAPGLITVTDAALAPIVARLDPSVPVWLDAPGEAAGWGGPLDLVTTPEGSDARSAATGWPVAWRDGRVVSRGSGTPDPRAAAALRLLGGGPGPVDAPCT